MGNNNHVNSILGNWLPFFKLFFIVVCIDDGGGNDWMEMKRCESCGMETYALDLPDVYSDSFDWGFDTFINIYLWIESWKCLHFSWLEGIDPNICSNKGNFPLVPRHNDERILGRKYRELKASHIFLFFFCSFIWHATVCYNTYLFWVDVLLAFTVCHDSGRDMYTWNYDTFNNNYFLSANNEHESSQSHEWNSNISASIECDYYYRE